MPSLESTLSYKPAELAFGTSGLRGLVSDMTDLECYINTVGFLQFLIESEGLVQDSTVYIAGDLRVSTPRILATVRRAVIDQGLRSVYCGLIPTPAIAYFALQKDSPCIMVTGSHIPANRNGIKFYKCAGEVLKGDEAGIKAKVAAVREQLYEAETAVFSTDGMMIAPDEMDELEESATAAYASRFTSVFSPGTLQGKKIVFYQHSSVGRDLLVDILEKLGAEVTPVGRSDVFVPIDSENVTPDDQAYFTELVRTYPDAFAVVSTDGDSDRPFVVDENGVFHRGDVLGAVAAAWLGADFAAYPVSSSDAVDTHLKELDITFQHTKIGSPYVIEAMMKAEGDGMRRTVAWEVNGGFMTGNDFSINDKVLKALPTRDALLPIVCALVTATEKGASVSSIFGALPRRFSGCGLIDNFPNEISARITDKFGQDSKAARTDLAHYFTSEYGFGDVATINTMDGVRVYFSNGDIAHLRPSGNAPQLRIYSVADSQARADEIVRLAIQEPDGIFRQIERDIE